MALIKMAHIIAEARGKIGGTVFSRNTYGPYIRAKVTPVNPASPAQQGVRAFMTAVAQAWKGLTAPQRLTFSTGALDWTHINIFGDQVNLSGFNLFVMLNRNCLEVASPQITDMPPKLAPGQITSFSLAVDNIAPKFELTYAPAIAATDSVIVYATAPLSAGVDFVKSEYRKIAVILLADASPHDAKVEYIAKFGALPALGNKSFCKLLPIVTLTGVPGSWISDSAIAT